MLGSLVLYLKGMRILMFQLSGFYYRDRWVGVRRGRCLQGWRGLRTGSGLNKLMPYFGASSWLILYMARETQTPVW